MAALLASLALSACINKVDAEPQQSAATVSAAPPPALPMTVTGRKEALNLTSPGEAQPVPGIAGSPGTYPDGNNDAQAPKTGSTARSPSANSNARNPDGNNHNAQSLRGNNDAQSPSGTNPGVAPTSH